MFSSVKGWIPIILVLMAALPFLYFCWSKRNFIFIAIVVIVLIIAAVWIVSRVRAKKTKKVADIAKSEKKEKGEKSGTKDFKHEEKPTRKAL